jgi:hypothetical protein
MIITLRNNKALLKKRKNIFDSDNSFGKLRTEYKRAAKNGLVLKEASAEELLEIRKKIIVKRKKEARRRILFASIFFVLSAGLIAYWLSNWRVSYSNQVRLQKEAQLSKGHNKYLFYIADGDEWLNKGKWKNAIFQYKLALDMHPTNFDVRYRLALAYASACTKANSYCAEGELLVFKLLDEQPTNKELKKIAKEYYNLN